MGYPVFQFRSPITADAKNGAAFWLLDSNDFENDYHTFPSELGGGVIISKAHLQWLQKAEKEQREDKQ